MSDSEEPSYAGLWLRFLTFIVDTILFAILFYLLESLTLESAPILLKIISYWLYSSLLLSSKWHATIGKKILGLSIYGEQGEGLTFYVPLYVFSYPFYL